MKAILTGHSRGLGAAIAEDLLGRKIEVLALSRQGNADLSARYPALLEEVAIDLADSVALAHWLKGDKTRHFLANAKTILLINNAGTVQPIGPAETQELDAIARAVQLNVSAPLMLTSALAAARGSADLRVVHISSGAGRKAYAGWNIYCATKAALDHHVRAAFLDNSPGIRLCSLAPGIIDTDMQAELRGTAEEKFPLRNNFVAMKRDGELVSPADAARKLVTYVIGDTFGAEPIADLREIVI
jgi:hypothetical protein